MVALWPSNSPARAKNHGPPSIAAIVVPWLAIRRKLASKEGVACSSRRKPATTKRRSHLESFEIAGPVIFNPLVRAASSPLDVKKLQSNNDLDARLLAARIGSTAAAKLRVLQSSSTRIAVESGLGFGWKIDCVSVFIT